MSKVSERREWIIDYCSKHTTVLISDLVELIPASIATIRRDLTELEKSGQIHKFRNRIQIVESHVPSFISREHKHQAEKTLIANAAIKLISPFDSVMIDAGTTTMALAKCIASRNDLTVLTNSVPIAMLLNDTNIKTFLSGGFLMDTALMDDDAVAFFASRKVNKTFLSATSIHEDGITTVSPFRLAVKREMIKSANEVYILADSSKFTCAGVNLVAPFSDITGIVTDRPVSNPRILEKLKMFNVKIIVA